MMCVQLAALILSAYWSACSCPAQGMVVAAPRDVTQLWCGYDPRTLPLDIEVREEKIEDGVRLQRVYFTGEPAPAGSVRVYAITGVPIDAKGIPGILHVHGGGQTASMEWVRYWTRRGYAAVSLDWCGEKENRTDYTRWNGVKANMLKDGQAHTTQPSVRESPWYHWALVSRRALTLLEELPGVDPQRLGLFGVSVGGVLTWMLAGVESRVHAAAPIYACGWNTYPDVHSGGGYTHPVPPEVDLWRATMEPETYARYVTCPLLQLNATNDFHAHMDRSYDTLARVRAPTWQSQTVRYSHHLEPEQGRTLERWFAWQLRGGAAWPESPKIHTERRDGKLDAIVTCDRPDEVADVHIYAARGSNRPQTRFWRTLKTMKAAHRWQATIPIIDAGLTHRVFANVTYQDGVSLSSHQVVLSPTDLAEVQKSESPTLLIDDFREGVEDWTFSFAYTDPHFDWSYLHGGSGPDGSDVLTFNPDAWRGAPVKYQFGTHKVGDPGWSPPPAARLAFSFKGEEAVALKVHVLVDQWGPRSREYIAEIKLSDTAEWQEFRVEAERFATSAGQKLTSFDGLNRIDFSGESSAGRFPQFARVQWIRGDLQVGTEKEVKHE